MFYCVDELCVECICYLDEVPVVECYDNDVVPVLICRITLGTLLIHSHTYIYTHTYYLISIMLSICNGSEKISQYLFIYRYCCNICLNISRITLL